jgi:pyrroloquinoline quinone biosynthesis protein B
MKIMILGSGQDAGVPQVNCFCKICTSAIDDVKYRRFGPSIAIYGDDSCHLIDASSDLKYQLDLLKKDDFMDKSDEGIPISGILLTHAHLGHLGGLWQLGNEAACEKNVLVYCTSKMKTLLTENYPFNLLEQSKNIKIIEIKDNHELKLGGFKCTPILVPHRNEVANTLGYIIESQKRIIYVPDIDRFTETILREIKNSDIALIDGTFYSRSEFPRFDEVPHPPILETAELFENIDCEVYFTHINHTNPINLNGEEKEYIEKKGFKIASDGLVLDI